MHDSMIEWLCRDSFCSNPEPRPAKHHPGTGHTEQQQISAGELKTTHKCQSKTYLGFESSSLPRPTKMSPQKVSWWHVSSGTCNNLAVTTQGSVGLQKPLWELRESLAPGTPAAAVSPASHNQYKQRCGSLLSHLWALYLQTK